MQVKTFALGPLSSNCYLIYDETLEVSIVDPGGEGDYLSEIILRENLTLKSILLTHGHYDHVLGILPLKLNFNPDIYLHFNDTFLYKKAPQSYSHWEGLSPDPLPSPDVFFEEGEGIRVGISELTVIETPGHTPGSVCLYNRSDDFLFAGDTLFKGGVGRTDLSYSNESDLRHSLEKIARLPGETKIYPGHGETSTIARELNT